MVESKQQLEALLGDPGYSRTIAALTKEVMGKWNMARAAARSIVLSAIGEPTALATIYQAWVLAKAGGKRGVVGVITRRRVLDLLAGEARRVGHSSLPDAADELETSRAYDHLRVGPDADPRTQFDRQQVIHLVRGAIACFASLGAVERRQASLLQDHVLDEIPYSALSKRLECSEVALRVRVHAAMKALHKHILWCHPELQA